MGTKDYIELSRDDGLTKWGLTDAIWNGDPAVKIPYLDEDGHRCAVRFRLAMTGENRFRWETGSTRHPYGLWRLDQARDEGYVVMPEGESDTHTLWFNKFHALDLPSATSWTEAWADYLDGIRKIYVSIEKDRGGRAVLDAISKSPIRTRVYLVRLEDAKDPSDLYLHDPSNCVAAFQKALDAALPWSDEAVAEIYDWLPPIKVTSEPCIPVPPWPDRPAQEAFHGLAGDLVHIIEPHSESDPAALLTQILVIFGSVIGRRPYFRAEADRHHTNLFNVIVGRTSKGRKGSSLSQVMAPIKEIDPVWTSNCVQSGLSSGEGLIWAVRDPISRREPTKKAGHVTGYQTVITDHGIEDKRLLVKETEFASILQMLKREGNTLSPTIRQAWDSGDLRILNKNSPATASGAHISIIGHITREELRRHLSSTEIGNGFANRFLWTLSQRSRILPEGGNLDDADLDPIINGFRKAVQFARGVHEMKRDTEARELWIEVYPKLSEGYPGLLGAVLSRAEAQVMRLACIYALLDCSPSIGINHLQSALAVWRYCEASARNIFGDSLGSPVADDLLNALRQHPNGLTRTQMRDLFKRNKTGAEIDTALLTLQEYGLAHLGAAAPGSGRPPEVWFAASLEALKGQG